MDDASFTIVNMLMATGCLALHSLPVNRPFYISLTLLSFRRTTEIRHYNTVNVDTAACVVLSV